MVFQSSLALFCTYLKVASSDFIRFEKKDMQTCPMTRRHCGFPISLAKTNLDSTDGQTQLNLTHTLSILLFFVSVTCADNHKKMD